MRADLPLLHHLHQLSLKLFPNRYREEYGEELQAVFRLSLEDAANRGGSAVTRLILREIGSLPKAAILAHLREKRSGVMIGRLDFANGSWKEFLIALMPFLLPGVFMPLLGYLYVWKLVPTSGLWGAGIILALLGLLLTLLLVGVQLRMPRWSLPYLGFVSSIFSVYLFSAFFGTPIYFLFRDYRGSSLLMDILWDGIFWYGLLTGMVWLVIVTRVSPRLQRFRQDWTLPCFILYGAIPFAIWLSFDEYIGDEPYTLLIFVVLTVGAWIYLRSEGEWRRFGALFGAMSIAMFIATAGKAILVPKQTWPITIDAGLALSEVKHAIIMWGWFVFIMLIPLAIKSLPRSDDSIQPAPPEG